MKVFYVLFALWLCFVSFMVGGILSTSAFMREFSYLTGGQAEITRCSEKGCSILVKNADQSKNWVWIPTVKKLEKE